MQYTHITGPQTGNIIKEYSKPKIATMKSLHIQTSRLYIRPLGLSDLSDFHLYRSDPDVARYQGFDVMTMKQAETFISNNLKKRWGKAGEWVQYGIEKMETGQLIGDCAIRLDRNETRIAEIGMTIAPPEQKKGFAKECLKGILDFLFDTKDIHRVVAITDVENTGSITLLESVGFRREGHFTEHIFFKGKWGSEFQYAMLRREWDDKNKMGKTEQAK